MTISEDITDTPETKISPTNEEEIFVSGEDTARLWEVTAQRDELQRQLAERNAQLGRTSSLLEETRGRVSGLTNERDSLQRRLSQALSDEDAKLERFKEQVVEVASRYAEDNDWCSVIDNALNELGLERKTTVYGGVITITVAFHAELNRGKTGLPSQRWVRDSLSLSSIRGAIEDSLEFDADHESSEVDSVEFAISGLELRS
jgi:hypothetical protein